MVEHQDGWTSLGSDFVFADYQSQQKMDFYDRYRRGVSITFTAMGKVTKFDYVMMMNQIIAGLVLIQFVDKVVKIVASFALPESKQYTKVMSENFLHKKALATFGINVAMACQAFKTWDTGKSGNISEEELKAVFRGSFNEDLSKHFVDVIMDVAHEQGNENEVGATCEDLVHIMSSGIVSIEELQKIRAGKGSSKKEGKDETKVAPEGEA
jgi:hypothetical protein